MQFKAITFIVFILAFYVLHGQEYKELASQVGKNHTILTVISPGISHEIGLSTKSTMLYRAHLRTAGYMSRLYNNTVENTYENFKLRIDLRPAIDLEYRYYYNLKKGKYRVNKPNLIQGILYPFLEEGWGPLFFIPVKHIMRVI